MRCFLRAVLLLVLLAAAGAGGGYLYMERYFSAPGPLDAPITVHIPPGTGFKAIVAQLHTAHVIDHPSLFMARMVLDNAQQRFKAGEYAFAAGATPKDVAEKLISGDVVVYSVTIPEGLTGTEILALLAAEKSLSGPLPASVAEGSLLPETYHFVQGDSRQSVVLRMRKAMTATLTELWKNRRDGLPLATPDDAIILASIVEKETGMTEERPRVAAVFLNRLVIGMKLQSDPTVAYGLLHETGQAPARLLKKHLAVPTAFNTYMIPALPPAPIANPGKASLEAVLQAPSTDELYFVADGTGGHRFARDLRTHNENVRHWRNVRKSTP